MLTAEGGMLPLAKKINSDCENCIPILSALGRKTESEGKIYTFLEYFSSFFFHKQQQKFASLLISSLMTDKCSKGESAKHQLKLAEIQLYEVN